MNWGNRMQAVLRSLLFLVASAACSVVQAQSCSNLEAARWLLGEWRATRGDRQILERWQQVSSATFEGMGTTSRDSRLLESETLRLVAMEQRVFYVAKVAHNDLPVAFALTRCDSQRLVFENPAHDFPRKLEYQLTGADTLSVRVSDGGEKGFTLRFSRQRAQP